MSIIRIPELIISFYESMRFSLMVGYGFEIDCEQVALLAIQILDLIPPGVLQEVPVPPVENIRIRADRARKQTWAAASGRSLLVWLPQIMNPYYWGGCTAGSLSREDNLPPEIHSHACCCSGTQLSACNPPHILTEQLPAQALSRPVCSEFSFNESFLLCSVLCLCV